MALSMTLNNYLDYRLFNYHYLSISMFIINSIMFII